MKKIIMLAVYVAVITVMLSGCDARKDRDANKESDPGKERDTSKERDANKECDTNKEKVQTEAVALFKADKWDEACKLAETTPITNPELQCFMGRVSEKKGLTSNAFKYYEKSAQQGFAEAQYRLGTFYVKGISIDENGGATQIKDTAQGISLYEKAAAQGYAEALCELGVCYFNGTGVEKDLEKAFGFFKKAAELGLGAGMKNVGVCYENGFGIGKDETKAVEWYKKGAEKNYVNSQLSLANMYMFGKGTEKDLPQAIALFTKVAEKKVPEEVSKEKAIQASCALANIYYGFQGDGVPKDISKAIKWWEKAANLGDASSAWNLYGIYITEEGIERNFRANGKEAVKWLKKAVVEGDFDIKGKEESLYLCLDWFDMVADEKDADAMTQYATFALMMKDKPAKNGKQFMSVFNGLPAGEIRDQYCKVNRQELISNLRAELDGRASSILWLEHSDPSFCFVEYWKDRFFLDNKGWCEVMSEMDLKKSRSRLWLAACERLKSNPPPDGTNTLRIIATSVVKQGRELWNFYTGEFKGKKPTTLKLQNFANDAVGYFVCIENARIYSVSADRVIAYVKLPNSEVEIRVQLTHIVPPKTRNASGNILDDYLADVANRDNPNHNSSDPSDKLFDKLFKHTKWLDLEEGQNATIYGYIKNDDHHPIGVNVEGRIHVQKK